MTTTPLRLPPIQRYDFPQSFAVITDDSSEPRPLPPGHLDIQYTPSHPPSCGPGVPTQPGSRISLGIGFLGRVENHRHCGGGQVEICIYEDIGATAIGAMRIENAYRFLVV